MSIERCDNEASLGESNPQRLRSLVLFMNSFQIISQAFVSGS